jgi:hypothetical protein
MALAQGTGQSFQYQAVINNQVQAVTPSPGLTMPATNVGSTSSANFTVQNIGSTAVTLGQIASQNPTVFQVTSVSSLTIPAGKTISFTLVFAPSAPGQVSSTLPIGTDQIALSGLGIGPSLTFTAGGTMLSMDPAHPLIFTNTPVGSRSSTTILIANTGNAAGSLTSLAATSGPYSITLAPTLPLVLAPGDTATFTLTFVPQAIGNATGVLQADNLTFNLRGVGTPPASLPAISFTSVPAQAQPLDQPSIGIHLASSYPSDITGLLTLSFGSTSFGDDSSIQFATGGRTITFQVPANSTDAVFFTGNKTVAFQAGTVAGTITFQATFAIGQADVTPGPVPTATVTVPSLAPTIRSVQVASSTATGLQLLVSGYSTPKSVQELMLNFAATPGYTLQGASLSADVDFSFTTWYQSTLSQPFGSQFTATVNISISGNGNALSSVSVSASNATGTSNAISTALR